VSDIQSGMGLQQGGQAIASGIFSPPPPPPRPTGTPKLNAALAIAQGAFKPIAKSGKADVRMREGGSYTFRYSTLSDVLEGVQTALTASALAVTHAVRGKVLYSTLGHESGEERTTEFDLSKVDMVKIQVFGSALTYGQRYGTKLLCNLASDDDDDGQQVEAPRPRFEAGPVVRQPTPQQARELARENVTVGDRMARGADAATNLQAQALKKAEEAIASFRDMDLEALRLWWRDSADSRESWADLYPDVHDRVMAALDDRRDALKAVGNG
jgi:hypothetical protein